MDDAHELFNLRVIRVTTEAAMLSAPQYADAHRRRASQLLDEAAERTTSRRARDDIDALRRHLDDGIGDEEEGPAES